jgi:hypothetical protein
MLIVVRLSDVMLCVAFCIAMVNDVMLGVIMPSVVMLNVIMLCVPFVMAIL